MAKKILAIEANLASDEVDYSSFKEKASLLDWDIVIFRPDISYFLEHDYDDEQYQGRLCLNDTKSFKLREACEHWRREILQAIDAGKHVIVFQSIPQEVFAATGTKTASGTGRNRITTRHVDLVTNYSSLPIRGTWTATEGSSMALVPRDGDIVSSYWQRFRDQSKYHLVWGSEVKGVCITTQHGQKPVGMIYRSSSSTGALVLLPDLDFDQAEFSEQDEDGEDVWSEAGAQFASSLIVEIVSLSKTLVSDTTRTPEPGWAESDDFASAVERELHKQLLVAETEIEKAQKAKDEILAKLEEAGRLRNLLFEKGRRLEEAIISALTLMGFSATAYKSGDSEFDVVFESAEGRLLGEAEGKDNKPVNVDKLRQLSMNIHEDLQREEVTDPAKGILFGNGHRLTAPAVRPPQFTEKCISAAASFSIGLVQTDELYKVARSLLDGFDEPYARACRSAMITGIGLVEFPTAPVKEIAEEEAIAINL